MNFKKPSEKYASEALRICMDNMILLVPMIGVGFVSLMVFAGLGAVLFFACVKQFLTMGYNLRDPRNLPWDSILDYFSGFAYYFAALFFIGMIYCSIVTILHRSGYGLMHARAVTTGKTSLSDYFEGIARFSSRMLWLVTMRFCVLASPYIIVGLLAVAALRGGSSSPGIAVVIVLLLGAVVVFDFVAMFFMLLWKASMFIRDSSVSQALSDSLAFIRERFWNILFFVFIWFVSVMTISFALSVFESFFRLFAENGNMFLTMISSFFLFGISMVRCIVSIGAKIYFSIFYYKFYHDETSPDVPYSYQYAAPYQNYACPPQDPYAYQPQEPYDRRQPEPEHTEDPQYPETNEQKPDEGRDTLPPGFC